MFSFVCRAFGACPGLVRSLPRAFELRGQLCAQNTAFYCAAATGALKMAGRARSVPRATGTLKGAV